MVDLSAMDLTADKTRREGKANFSARAEDQRQQCTSATAQSPTAMSAKTWHSVLPDAASMAEA
jgi:hypothetical protein